MYWGLIGASNIASQYMIEAIRSVPGNDVLQVFSSDARRAQDYAARHNIPEGVSSLDAVLANDRVGAVYISTTNEKHFPQAMAAIKAGKHVMCEKPLAMNTDDAATMVRAADARGVVFATNHHLRNAGSHLAIRDLIKSGRIGGILSVRVFHAVCLPPNLRGWRINNAAAGGGVILDIVVHDADTVRFHLDEDPAEVVAMATAPNSEQEVEDNVMSTWFMPSGVMVQAHDSFTHGFAGSGLEVHGAEGSIIARDVMTQRPVGEIVLVTAGQRQAISFSDHNLYARSLRLFEDAVNGTGRPAADGVDGVKSLAVAEAVVEAAATGVRTAVNYQCL